MKKQKLNCLGHKNKQHCGNEERFQWDGKMAVVLENQANTHLNEPTNTVTFDKRNNIARFVDTSLAVVVRILIALRSYLYQ